jgi:chorismate mutase/prephenate dehydratase
MELASLRARIDALDDSMLALLDERARLVQEVARWKEQNAAPFHVPDRERRVIDRLTASSRGPFPARAIRPVWSEIMSACLSLEQRLRVSFLGPEATFTHQAARSRFGLSALYLPAATIAGVFADVEHGSAELGVVPVENSTEGMVNHTLDLFIDSELTIQQEIMLRVSHGLLTRADTTAAIHKVYSHPQALAQCRGWLAANLPGAALVEVASTALASQMARDDVHAAAVASEMAADLYDLPILRRPIEDERVNITRFLVLGPRPAAAPPGSAGPGPAGGHKTSLMFILLDRPGGLHTAIAPFAERRVNLSRIESRPSRRRAWDYVFFIDLDGHQDDPEVAAAIAAFSRGCELVKILGSYPRSEAQ